MTVERIIHDVPPDRVASVVAVIVQLDGGTAKEVPQADGLVTVVGTFEIAALPPAISGAGQPGHDWMAIAEGEIGTKEAVGGADNPRVVEYSATTQGGATPDSVPWCSSFVNFCITRAGLQGTNLKNARSWVTWGHDVAAPVPGCVIVLWRESPASSKGHVGFYVGMESGRVQLLGGNQGDAVKIASFEADRIIARRMP